MLRILLLLLLLLAVIYLAKAWWKQLTGGTPQPGPGAGGGDRVGRRGSSRGGSGTLLLACARCGLHVPADRALSREDDGQVFCSQACRSERVSGDS